jgi:hypothetical protein
MNYIGGDQAVSAGFAVSGGAESDFFDRLINIFGGRAL